MTLDKRNQDEMLAYQDERIEALKRRIVELEAENVELVKAVNQQCLNCNAIYDLTFFCSPECEKKFQEM